MNEIIRHIEAGKQRGFSKDVVVGGEKYWCDAAIQKMNGKYKVHVSVIKEQNMSSEKYEVYFTREFECLNTAIECVNNNGMVKFDDFTALKGQKIFDAKYNEENET